MRATLLLPLLLLAGCGDPVEEALAAYNQSGTSRDRCAKAAKVASAYIESGDPQSGALWRTVSNSDCVVARAEAIPTDAESVRRIDAALDRAAEAALSRP